jgi:hypothetical protein
MPNYCPERMMESRVRQISAAISAAALIFCCSCEKHHLGENPEYQKEHTDEAKSGGEENATRSEKSTSEASPPRMSPTPAEFFPESKPSP